MINRRGFLTGLIAAPAIVSINNIMPVRVFDSFTAATDWAARHREMLFLQVQINKIIGDIICPPVIYDPVTHTVSPVPRVAVWETLDYLLDKQKRLRDV